MSKVSVIMPCLNMEKYIGECLRSVIDQTLSDLEIILVDAGSEDGTLDIIHRFMKEDKRITLFHSDIKSYGYQMNLAMSVASSEFICIVETDDYIEPDMVEILYREITESGADYVKGCAQGFFRFGDRDWRYDILPAPELNSASRFEVNPSERANLFLHDTFLWNGIYRRDFLVKYRFQETKGAAFQDIGVLFQLIHGAAKAVYLNKMVYHYRQDNGVASSYNNNSLNYVKHEYEALERLLPDLSEDWIWAYYQKMAGHTLNRFYFMATGKQFWTGAEESIGWLKRRLEYALKSNILPSSKKSLVYFHDAEWKELQMLLSNEYEYYEYRRNVYLSHIKVTAETIGQLLEHDVVIFGCGRRGRSLCRLLRLFGVNVICFCDNSVDGVEKLLDGIRVISPKRAVSECTNAFFATANAKAYLEMQQQLIRMGISESRIIISENCLFYDMLTVSRVLELCKNVIV